MFTIISDKNKEDILLVEQRSVTKNLHRVRTHPGKPGIYWNLIIRIPGLEYTGILSKVLENTGI